MGALSARPAAADGGVTCPTDDLVWAEALALVPSAHAELTAAKSRVTLHDEGERLQVRVDLGTRHVQRTYLDPARDCSRRARVAAEFIVLAILPPVLPAGAAPTAPVGSPATSGSEPSATPGPAVSGATPSTAAGPSTTGVASTGASTTSAGASTTTGAAIAGASRTAGPGSPPETSTTTGSGSTRDASPLPSATAAPVAVRAESGRAAVADAAAPRPGAGTTRVAGERGAATRRWPLRAEADGALWLAPGWPSGPFAWQGGAELRAAMQVAGVGGFVEAGYDPAQGVELRAVRARLARVGLIAGVRATLVRRVVGVDVDLGLGVAYERYEGISPHAPLAASRWAPDAEAAVVARAPAGREGAFVRIACQAVPWTSPLVALPEGQVGRTPAIWIAGEAGFFLGP